MKLASFNANSIRARLPVILDWLKRESPDILCVQETKVQDKDFPLDAFKKAGFGAVFRGQKSYNGVAVISRHPLEGVVCTLYEEDEDARFISVDVCGISVINVYVPQGFEAGTQKFDYKLSWLRGLLSFLKDRRDPSRPLIVAGDFNVALEDRDLFDPDRFRGEVAFHPEEQSILKDILKWGLFDIFRKHVPEGGNFTFWDYRIPGALKRNLGWRIDYILATSCLAEKSRTCWIDTKARALEKPSDHTFLVAEFEL